MEQDFEIYAVDPAAEIREREEIIRLLATCSLGFEEHLSAVVVARRNGRLIACAGLEHDIVKCVTIVPEERGGAISLLLMNEVFQIAQEKGHGHLFLFTRPENVAFFQGCGFHSLAEVPQYVTLMENSPIGIRRYCDRLNMYRRPGETIGGIVINANPFTYGHQYLIRKSAQDCDWLHVFVVAEDASFISYSDRYQLVKSGICGMPNITLHHGSRYMVSRATFPEYFFKEKNVAGDCCTAIDLLVFRNFIAPAIGITHRFVGTEPFCSTTRKYNDDMKQWLQKAPSSAPPITVIEEERLMSAGVPISASQVRRLLRSGDFDQIKTLVPPATYQLLLQKYRPSITPFASEPDAEPEHRLLAAVSI